MKKVFITVIAVIVLAALFYISYIKNKEQQEAFNSISVGATVDEVRYSMGTRGESVTGDWHFHFWGGVKTKSQKNESCVKGLLFESYSKAFEPRFYTVCFDENNKAVSKLVLRSEDFDGMERY